VTGVTPQDVYLFVMGQVSEDAQSRGDDQVIGTRDGLRELPDEELLDKVHTLPRSDQERADACEILVDRYTKLVRSCVRRYRNSPEPAEDLMQVGYVGLLKAINHFDPAAGGSLFAYAAPCVSGEIKRHFRDKRWLVRVRREAQELVLELHKAGERLAQELGHTPGDGELAERLGVSADEVQEAREADMVFSAYSLDAPVTGDREPVLLADTLGDEDPGVQHAVDMAAVSAHWEELSERDQRILIMRFYGNLTQSEIGDQLGLSQMHVSRLLSRALGHLRNRLVPASDAT
jgi:RNA polymerase sigma-B factor